MKVRALLVISALLVACGTSSATPDGGANDAGLSDAGQSDAGLHDAGSSDAGSHDAGSYDAGLNDAGASDGGLSDAGLSDAGNDAGLTIIGGVPGGVAGPGAVIAGCRIFPPDNAWNTAIDGPGVMINHAYDSQLSSEPLHPDFGDWTTNHYGLPWSAVDGGQPDIETRFTLYANQSDPGPGGWIGANPVASNSNEGTTAWPFFIGLRIEGDPPDGGTPGELATDQHALVLQQGASGCKAYEAWSCIVSSNLPFTCANGAVFDLTSNTSRPLGWTSADVAGLSVLAGLVKYDEVAAGAVNHAIRVMLINTQSGYIPPATHTSSPRTSAGPLGSAYPPFGLRLRLKASVPVSGYLQSTQTILLAMKKYGLIVADNGSDWFFQGDSDDRWTALAPDGRDTLIDEMTRDFAHLTGADFEAVYTGEPIDTGL